MVIQVLYDILVKKYPIHPGEKSNSYMQRLLAMRKGETLDSKLFVETEVMMLFILLRVIRVELQKTRESGSDTTELAMSYFHNKERLDEFINKWTDLNT